MNRASKVEEELGQTLRRVAEARLAIPSVEDRMAHVGFQPQRQEGRQYVGVVLPVGRITSEQARGLSEIVETYGNGELRFTVWQNVLIPNIRDGDVDEVKRELDLNVGQDPSWQSLGESPGQVLAYESYETDKTRKRP